MTVAILGTVAALGFAGMHELVEAEQARNASARFATDLRRERSEAIQKRMYSYVETVNSATGVTAVFRQKRTGSVTNTPCEEMAAGTADSTTTAFYQHVQLNLTGAGATTASMCFTQMGAPRADDLMTPEVLDIELTRNGNTQLHETIDAVGVVASSLLTESTGIASTSLHPMDTMRPVSAPVPPDALFVPEMPYYETDPGVYVEAGSTGGSGGVSPCDPFYGTCPSACVTDPTCPTPCDACFDPCAADPCSCDPCLCVACCTVDPVTGVCI